MKKDSDVTPTSDSRSFAKRVSIVLLLVALFVALAFVLWKAAEVLLLFFAGALLAVILRTASHPVTRWTKLKPRWSVSLMLVLMISICGAVGWIAAPTITEQFKSLRGNLAESVETFSGRLEKLPAGEKLADKASEVETYTEVDGDMYKRIGGVFSSTLGALSGLLVIVISGLFMAYDPHLYLVGALRLVPPSKRERTREVIVALEHTLRGWLIGQGISMVFLFATTWIMLAALGVPLAFILALLTGLFTFVPYIGPLLAIIPILLVAFVESPTLALYTGGLYLVIQNVEGSVLMPLIYQRTVALPPVITIAGQLILGGIFGALGFILATPLTAVALVLVRKLYVEDVLGDSMEEEIEELAGTGEPP